MRIPFDSLTLAAVISELQPLAGAKLQRVTQIDDLTVNLELYARGLHWLTISADPQFSRIHRVSRRPEGVSPLPAFGLMLRTKLQNSRLARIQQIGFDRIAHLTFETFEGDYTLVAELMGKHANIMLVASDHRIVAAAKVVSPSHSIRPVVLGRAYAPPPFPVREPYYNASAEADPTNFEGASPFLIKLVRAGLELSEVKRCVESGSYAPVITEAGAYPLSIRRLGFEEVAAPNLNVALERTLQTAQEAFVLTQRKAALRTQLERILLSREVALQDLREARSAAHNAQRHQRMGELILAYQGSIQSGSENLDAYDYDGEPISIPLRADRTPVENSTAYFERAKHARARQGFVEEQLARMEQDVRELGSVLRLLETARTLAEVEELERESDKRKWRHRMILPTTKKEDRPYQGKRVREAIAPGGLTVLYGENAEANDYLTLRIAKPDDIWLHVRGATSAHVVIQTQRKPERVQPETLRFAARIAVMNSPSKHGGFVPVDYTQRRFVRKIKGTPLGTVTYTHEKTIHVDLSDEKR